MCYKDEGDSDAVLTEQYVCEYTANARNDSDDEVLDVYDETVDFILSDTTNDN